MRSLLLLAALAADGSAFATQVIDGADRRHVEVNVSAGEANRLSVEGRRIKTVVPGQPGLINARADEASGAVFIQFAPGLAKVGATGAPALTLFITDSESVTYKIIAIARGIQAEDVILRPPRPAATEAVPAASRASRADGRGRRITDLMLAMADEALPVQGIDRKASLTEVRLWQEAKLTLVSTLLAPGLVGEKYRLTNTSAADMVIVEQELYRDGVLAISVRDHTLSAGQGTEIYVVRERLENE